LLQLTAGENVHELFMNYRNTLTQSLNLKHPLVMAPMFLVSNEAMLHAGMDAGILAAFPSLNYRKNHELETILQSLNKKVSALRETQRPGNYAVNLIVQQTNTWYRSHLEICVAQKVPVYITSLGNPKEVIARAHAYGAKVFCDVTNLVHAKKCNDLGCDGFVAVGHGAGGHAGNNPLQLLTESLRRHFPSQPVLAAGGIATGRALLSALASGASAAYIGTRFIASTESDVLPAYKESILQSGMEDIIMTERLSGTPCAVINTPFAQKIGTKQNRFEKWLSKNPRTKKYFKALVNLQGLKLLENAVKPGNYNNLWCAGQSVEMIHSVKPIPEIIEELTKGFDEALAELNREANP